MNWPPQLEQHWSPSQPPASTAHERLMFLGLCTRQLISNLACVVRGRPWPRNMVLSSDGVTQQHMSAHTPRLQSSIKSALSNIASELERKARSRLVGGRNIFILPSLVRNATGGDTAAGVAVNLLTNFPRPCIRYASFNVIPVCFNVISAFFQPFQSLQA